MKKNTSRIVRLLSIAVCVTLSVVIIKQKTDTLSDRTFGIAAKQRADILRSVHKKKDKHQTSSIVLRSIAEGQFLTDKSSVKLLDIGDIISRDHFAERSSITTAVNRWPEGTVQVRGVPAHPSRIMAKVRTGISIGELKKRLGAVGASINSDPNPTGWLTVNLPEPEGEMVSSRDDAFLLSGMKTLQASGLFESVEPDYLVSRAVTPGDQGLAQGWLWGLQNTGQNDGTEGIDIDAIKAWDTTTGSRDIVVAVIDTGIRYTHQELATQMWNNPDEIAGNGIDDDGDGYIDNVFGVDTVNFDGDPMDDNGHGTHCAGTIGAAANDGHAHVGVAWEVSLMACKFLSGDGWGYTSGAISAIDFAVANGARVLSNSWGGGGYSQSLYDAIVRARDAGVIFVAAAGNSGLDTDSQPNYPSCYDVENIISVAAIDRNGLLASWSNYGRDTVDVGAPGVDIFSSVSDSDSSYAYYSGTSMATPHVSGIVALMLANNERLSPSEVKVQVISTSVALDSLTGRTVSGGLVNAAAALNGGDDGQLELDLSISEDPLSGGRSEAIFATVTDGGPVIGAQVSGTMNGKDLDFSDDGESPDKNADDGVYTALVVVPSEVTVEQVVFVVTAEVEGLSPVNGSLTVSVVHTPANDDFEERAGLSGRKVSLAGFTNVGATSEKGERRHYYSRPFKTVWFTWTAPRNGRADIWLRGSSFDTVMAVYRGSTLTGLKRVARDDDSGGKLTSRVRFNVRKGRNYQFVVDGWGGDEGEIMGRLVVKKRKPFSRSKKWWR